MMSMKAFAMSLGLSVVCVNGIVEEHDDLDATWLRMAASGSPTVVGFTCSSQTFGEVRRLAERARAAWPSTVIAAGFDFAALNPERLLQNAPEIDIVCCGEGETWIQGLFEHLQDWQRVPNAVFRAEGVVRRTAPSHEPADLHALPAPHRDELATTLRAGFAAAVHTSRGCPFRCSYCTTGELTRLAPGSYRQRRIVDVVDEIEDLVTARGVEFINITDNLFLTRSQASLQWVHAFADALEERKLRFEFMFDARVDSFNRQAFARLRDVGLSSVFAGIETGSSEQSARYNKRYRLPQASPVSQFVTELNQIGVRLICGSIMFHAEVTPGELLATLDLLETTGTTTPYSLAKKIEVYPGTPLYREYLAKGYIDEGQWPVAPWTFRDPRMQGLHERVSAELLQTAASFESVKEVFLREVSAL